MLRNARKYTAAKHDGTVSEWWYTYTTSECPGTPLPLLTGASVQAAQDEDISAVDYDDLSNMFAQAFPHTAGVTMASSITRGWPWCMKLAVWGMRV